MAVNVNLVKQLREENGKKILQSTLKGSIFLSKLFMWLMQLSSIALFSYGLALSSKDQLTEPQHSIL
jgi:hypothetical protein